ncbi:threonine ammonia-lyase IlvA [Dermatophilaceae bacterium Sec6.4]|nr:threonine ammonia-lyase IlvA [Actinomycetota bacterium]
MTQVPNADDVAAAAQRLSDVASHTLLEPTTRLSALTGARVFLKREDLQPVRSYKIRGAYNLIAQLDDQQRARGVVCASAGNHAQGVALACAQLGVDARIHLPRTTPRQKRDRVIALGLGRVELVVAGETYDDAAAEVYAEARRTGATIVPAFDDPRTIAGQGTVAAEIVRQLGRAPDVLVVPVGGGGLLAGSIAALGADYPHTRIVGVEPEGAASMTAALDAGGPVTLETIDGFADGTAVRRVGDFTFPIVRDSGCEVRTISEGAICIEMLALYQSDGIIAEPSGAIASAAVLELDLEPDSTVVAIVSGGNNDVSRYGEVVERALIHEGRKHYFLVEFPQEPGALRKFLDEVLGPDDDIALFEYVKRNSREYGPALVGVELGNVADLQPLLDRMQASPLVIERVPNDSPMFRFLL